MTEPYRCSRCGTSFDDEPPFAVTSQGIFTVAECGTSGPVVKVLCQHPGCHNTARATSLKEALEAISRDDKN